MLVVERRLKKETPGACLKFKSMIVYLGRVGVHGSLNGRQAGHGSNRGWTV